MRQSHKGDECSQRQLSKKNVLNDNSRNSRVCSSLRISVIFFFPHSSYKIIAISLYNVIDIRMLLKHHVYIYCDDINFSTILFDIIINKGTLASLPLSIVFDLQLSSRIKRTSLSCIVNNEIMWAASQNNTIVNRKGRPLLKLESMLDP